jgi:release factor glutamine methyltransferase
LTLGEALRRGAEFLERKGIDNARFDAELLLAHALGLTRLDLYLQHDRPLTDDELSAARSLLERRARHEPTAYVLGEWGFRRLTLTVDPRVLIPRPGTEEVVERCLALIRDLDRPEVLDIGTGSGAIALAIADEHRTAVATATDVSEEALAVARANAERSGLAERVRFEQHDARKGLTGSYDLVVSNPPYVDAEEIETLQPEVRDWEPRAALVGSGFHELIAHEARGVLKPHGWLVLEVGDEQGATVGAMLRAVGYESVQVSRDLTGRDRVVEGRWELPTTP